MVIAKVAKRPRPVVVIGYTERITGIDGEIRIKTTAIFQVKVVINLSHASK
jgi:hypothetical protein